MQEPVSRFLESRHWGRMLSHHLDESTDYGVVVDDAYDYGWDGEGCPERFRMPYKHADIDKVADGSLSAVWLGDTSSGLSERILQWWPKLKPGGYIGGPSCGWGHVAGDRWATNTRAEIFAAAERAGYASRIITGNEGNPCWFAWKILDRKEKVLVISGADQKHTDAFGEESQKNHEAYCERHAYDYRWLIWDGIFPHKKERSPVWAKVWAMMECLKAKQWDQVWWIDGDAVFLDFGVELAKVLHPDWSCVHPEFIDNGRLMASTGVWGARAEELPGLQHVWKSDQHGFGYYSEEKCLSDSVHDKTKLWMSAQMVDHRLLHSILDQGVHFDEPQRNFILHLARTSNERRTKIMKQVNKHLGI